MAGKLFTFGYGHTPVAKLLDLMAKHGITVVVDVRRSPVSQWNTAFSGRALAATVPGYRHMKALGNKRGTQFGWVPEDSRAADAAISEIVELLEAGESVLLLCCEGNPMGCHRSVIATKIAGLADVPCEHLIARRPQHRTTQQGTLL